MSEVKQVHGRTPVQDVRQFYDQVGWQLVGDELYQNARYEDLRPVAREYIHRCHLRVSRYLTAEGRYLLDAGSGPIQYPEYLEYSRGYQYRVCADISITALKEARKRIGDHGLFVVADVANLPFKPGSFDGLVSLHTIHHLPKPEQIQAYQEIHRLLVSGHSGVVVNGWASPAFMRFFDPLVHFANRLRSLGRRLSGQKLAPRARKNEPLEEDSPAKGTYTHRPAVDWVKNEVGTLVPLEILVWRSVNVRFMRALIHPHLGGRTWLRLIYWLEERFPHWFGENGQYPLIVIRKP